MSFSKAILMGSFCLFGAFAKADSADIDKLVITGSYNRDVFVAFDKMGYPGPDFVWMVVDSQADHVIFSQSLQGGELVLDEADIKLVEPKLGSCKLDSKPDVFYYAPDGLLSFRVRGTFPIPEPADCHTFAEATKKGVVFTAYGAELLPSQRKIREVEIHFLPKP